MRKAIVLAGLVAFGSCQAADAAEDLNIPKAAMTDKEKRLDSLVQTLTARMAKISHYNALAQESINDGYPAIAYGILMRNMQIIERHPISVELKKQTYGLAREALELMLPTANEKDKLLLENELQGVLYYTP